MGPCIKNSEQYKWFQNWFCYFPGTEVNHESSCNLKESYLKKNRKSIRWGYFADVDHIIIWKASSFEVSRAFSRWQICLDCSHKALTISDIFVVGTWASVHYITLLKVESFGQDSQVQKWVTPYKTAAANQRCHYVIRNKKGPEKNRKKDAQLSREPRSKTFPKCAKIWILLWKKNDDQF